MVNHDKGSDHTDDDLVAGNHNWTEDPTILWGQKRPDSFFDGQAILIVGAAESAKDPDDYENDDGGVRPTFTPDTAVDGVIASGWTGALPGIPYGGIPGGVGVIGVGGRAEGTGVVGKGGGIKHDSEEPGFGGIGVHGLGGSRPDPDIFQKKWPGDPGAGIVGQGGRWNLSENTHRRSHGAGVIGIGGGTGHNVDILPGLDVTGGVGVFGQGADQDIDNMAFDPDAPEGGPPVPSGPAAPGNGVLARGGKSSDPAAPAAAGVVAISDRNVGSKNELIPLSSQTAGVGAFGSGDTGVRGVGDTGVHGMAPDRQVQVSQGLVLIPGVGVSGEATGKEGRGGLFQSVRSAQIKLEPIRLTRPFPPAKPTSPTHLPTAADEGSVADSLPSDGQGGDLIALMASPGESTLWFCALGAGAGPAQWAQVLLGPTFAGSA
jgi:hypothetical protein